MTSCGSPDVEPSSPQGNKDRSEVEAESPAAWLSTSTDSALLIRWSEQSDGQVTGVLQRAWLEETSVVGDSSAISGVVEGKNVTLSIEGLLGSGTTVTGDYTGESLTLFWPDDQGALTAVAFRIGSIDEYNDSVSALKQIGQARAEAEYQAELEAQEAEAEANALAAADAALATAHRNLELAIEDVEAAETWAGYYLDGTRDAVETLREEIAALEQTMKETPEYGEADLEMVEWSYEVLLSEADYALGPDSLGGIKSALASLESARQNVEEAIADVRYAEELYLNSEFAPYDASGELALIGEATRLIDVLVPARIESYREEIEGLLGEGELLIASARSLVP